MEIRHAIHPDHAETMNTEMLRKNFLIQDLFIPNRLNMTYSYDDRLIIGGISPTDEMALDVDPKIIGSDYLLQRREMGVINVGGSGIVKAGNRDFKMDHRDGLYIGMGNEDLIFSSRNPENPAMFYINSTPAHMNYPTESISFEQAEATVLGAQETSNHRTIRKYIHPNGIKSCQLVMGMTALEPGSIWNTMPVHTHGRRIEAYFYFNLPDEQIVFHFMGQPSQTRHIVIRNHEVALSPSWSIHSGAGTANYTFIWGMAGENQTFDDMDGIPMSEIR